MTGAPVSRRAVLGGIGGLALLGALGACASSYPDLNLTLATGTSGSPYDVLGHALADAWSTDLGLGAPPRVLETHGSVDNLKLLAGRAANVVFNQIDTATAYYVSPKTAENALAVRALARIYDDVVHVVVAADSPITSMAGLRGRRVALGGDGSGVQVMARRVLQALQIVPDRDLRASYLGLDDAVQALRRGTIDAFFWSGGLPTAQVKDLAAVLPIRLIDLQEDDLAAIRGVHAEYSPGIVPAGTYSGLSRPVTTLVLRNVLLVPADMADDDTYALVATLFHDQERIARASPNALAIDMRAAIGTQPIPLHPGAERWFRDARNSS